MGPVTNVHMHDFNSFYSHFPDDEPIQYTQDLVCEWKDAIVQVVTFPGNQVELCLSPGAVTGPGSKRRDVSIVRRKPVFHLDNDHSAAPELNSGGTESFFEDPSTGYAMQQVIGGNVPVLYTRLINYRPGDTIIEVVFDVRRGNLFGADPSNIYMVFHFHVYGVLDVIGSNGRFIGIGSFNVFHARGVYFNPLTGDYRANGWNAQNNQRNARREVFNCDTDSAGQELWYPGYITETAGQTPTANLRIEQFGNVLYRAGILAEGVLTNTLQDFNVYDSRKFEWAWPEGFNESPSFMIQGRGPGQRVDLAGEPSDLDGIPQGLQGDPTQDEH